MAAQFLIAEAYAQIGWKDKGYASGLKNAESAFAKFAQKFGSFGLAQATGFDRASKAVGGFTFQLKGATAQASQLQAQLTKTLAVAQKLKAAMAGGAGVSSPAAMMRAWGSSIGSVLNGLGGGLGKIVKGFESGMGSALKGLTSGFGAGMGSAMRGLFGGAGSFVSQAGTGISRILRAVGGGASQLIRGVATAGSTALRGLSSSIATILRPISAMIGSAGRMFGGGGLALGVGGIAGGLGVGLVAKEAADLESAMARLNRLSDLPKAKFEAMAAEIRQISGDMAGVSDKTIYTLAAFGLKMGVATDKLGLFVRDTARLSIAVDDMDPEQAASGLARLAGVFGLGTEQAGRFTAALVALDNASTASASDILSITQRFSGMAAVLGITPQKAMALAAATREAGVNPETAGSSLSQVLGKMGERGSHGAFGKIAGMSGKDFGGMVKSDALGALQAVAKGLKGMDAEHAIASLNGLHLQGQRVRQTLLGLAQTGGTLNRFLAVSAEEWDTQKSLMRNVAIESETLNAQWKRLVNNFNLTAAALGQALLPALKGLADGLVRLMADVRAIIEQNQATWTAWGKHIGDVLGRVGVLWRAWPLYVELAKTLVIEGFERMAEAAKNFATLAGIYLKNFGKATLDYFSEVFDALAAKITNALTGSKLKVAEPVWARNMKDESVGEQTKADMTRKTGIRNTGEMFGLGLKREIELGGKKAGLRLGIADASDAQKRDRANREAAQKAADARARAPSMMGRILGATSKAKSPPAEKLSRAQQFRAKKAAAVKAAQDRRKAADDARKARVAGIRGAKRAASSARFGASSAGKKVGALGDAFKADGLSGLMGGLGLGPKEFDAEKLAKAMQPGMFLRGHTGKRTLSEGDDAARFLGRKLKPEELEALHTQTEGLAKGMLGRKMKQLGPGATERDAHMAFKEQFARGDVPAGFDDAANLRAFRGQGGASKGMFGGAAGILAGAGIGEGLGKLIGGGVPGGRGLIKPDVADDAAGDAQALLKKHDEEIGLLRRMVASLESVNRGGVKVTV